jgi:hypothetical protein
MMPGQPLLLLAIALGASIVRGETRPPRTDLGAVTPVASCKLQKLTTAVPPQYERPAVLYSLQPPAEDPLANYERTPLGGWQMPAQGDRNDPWLRLLLVAPNRPIVIDLAVFIDGKAFREQREAWIDGVVAAAKTQASGEPVDGNKVVEALGTNGADGASVGDASTTAPSDESPPRLGGPTVAAQSRQAPSMRERMMNYLATNGEVPRDEVHWLLAEWGAGPSVVVLAPGLSWQRASMAPLLACVDQDADGALSANEISHAESLMTRADADGNDVIDVAELRRHSDRPAVSTLSTGHSLVVLLDGNTNWELLAANLVRVYGGSAEEATEGSSTPSIQNQIARGDSTIAGSQLEELCSVPADVTLRVDFSTVAEKDHPNPVSLLAVAPELAPDGQQAAVTTHDVISVAAAGDFVEISAAQGEIGKNNDTSASQLAIGAVIDGNPLERLLDRDQDGRFTRRERQELGGLLGALDRNRDGRVGGDEIPVPIRLAVTLGPQVHQLLRAPTGSARTIAPRDAAPAPPDWFVNMDKNGDRDLARGEFLGTTEQFRQFDADGDGLLSVAEVLKLNGTQ